MLKECEKSTWEQNVAIVILCLGFFGFIGVMVNCFHEASKEAKINRQNLIANSPEKTTLFVKGGSGQVDFTGSIPSFYKAESFELLSATTRPLGGVDFIYKVNVVKKEEFKTKVEKQ